MGEYGAIDTNPYVEVVLDEKAFGINPASATFVANIAGNGVNIFDRSQLYKSTNYYSGTIALNRDAYSNYDNDVIKAGYVNIDDVDTTIFDLANFTDLNNQLTNIGTGYTIWCAKDFSQNWNVYRVTETNNRVLLVANSLDGFVTFTTDTPHDMATGDIFLTRNFITEFDGFYQVEEVIDLNNILVKYSGDTTQLTTLSGDGMLFILDSIRFNYMETAREYVPPNGWKVGEKIWIDEDAETNAVQGQPFGTQPSGTWKVYEKTHPWEVTQRLVKTNDMYITFSNVALANSTSTLTIGGNIVTNITTITGNAVGIISNFLTSANASTISTSQLVSTNNIFPANTTVSSLTTNNEYSANIGYGQALKMIDNAEQTIFVGTTLYANLSISTNTGAVNVFDKNTANVYSESTTIVPDGANTFTYGSHIDTAVNGTHVRLAVNAPTSSGLAGAANVGLIYTYNKLEGETVWNRGQVIAGNVSVGGQFGHGFAFDELGDWLYVGAPYEATPKVYVYGLQRFITEATGNVTTSGSVSSITVPFTRDTTVGSTDADSILVTSATRTYIPRIDYTINGQTITFISGNISTATTLTISQGPYYTLLETIDGPVGSEFGFCIDASLNGAQLGVGAPADGVVGSSGNLLAQAGAVYIYDRVIEAFNSTTGTVYTTEENIASVHKVTVDDIEIFDYTVTGSNEITLFVPLGVGKNVKIETNKFTLLERVIGIDSLGGSLSAIQEGARFGTSLTICSNNCAFYIGAPFYNAGTIYNTGAVWKFHNKGTLYGINRGFTQNPTFTPGDTFRLDNFQITVTGTSLDSLIQDINDANLLGITAVNENGYLRIDSDKTVAKNRLRILSGSNMPGSAGVYADAGLAIFAFMQIIVNPYNSNNEYFGTKVILARNAYMLVISSDRGTTNTITTFDNDTTVIDDDSTSFVGSIKVSGSVYTYELYDDPRDMVEHPGRYAFCQQLDPTDLNTGDGFGTAIDIIGDYIIVSAPSDDTTITDGGSIYLFNNTINKRGWSLIRYQQPTVDVESVNKMYLYSNLSNTILTTLEFIDPAKGKILGRAEQEISYKTGYDPAVYNRGTNSAVSLNDNIFWSINQIGQVWWNLDQVRYIDYEQDSVTYRSINWGRLFPGSTIEVLEWVESAYLPSAYVAQGGEGIPKYADDSAYVELIYVDPVTNIISVKYYFWVKDKSTVDPNNETRQLPLVAIRDIIENPKNQGIPYAAIVSNNVVNLYNIANYLSTQNTILHIDYNIVKNTNIIHSEYELVQKGNADSIISPKIVNKLIDSLAGIDILGAEVPDPTLSTASKFGLGVRPRQTLFVDKTTAYASLVDYVNRILITKPIVSTCNLNTLNTQEAQPNVNLGECDLKINTDTELAYLDTDVLSVGYTVLVNQDTTRNNLWTVYTLSPTKTWVLTRVQQYKTSLYWNYVDWYAEGVSPTDIQLDYVVDTLPDALKLPVAVGDDILVKVGSGNSGWTLISVAPDLAYTIVGRQNGTIQLTTSNNDTIIPTTPTIEIRYIINALKDDIFIGELDTEFNNLIFVMINYALTEQKYVDWLFKTSFISVSHKLRSLLQYPNYIKDNQMYYENYISEVKPYSTKIREYSIKYDSTDEFSGSVTDFDLPAYYDTETKVFRSPSGENIIKDEALWQTDTYNQWYVNRNHRVENIIVENAGSGYTSEPIVTIVGGGLAATGATARAVIDFDLGTIIRIEVLTRGTGYYVTPTVIINGTNTTPATAYAQLGSVPFEAPLPNTGHTLVRTFDTKLKFDRISYTSSVTEWSANTAYTVGDIITRLDLNGIRKAYIATANISPSSTFISDNYSVYNASDFTNATDRIMGYYEPNSAMTAIESSSTVITTANTTTSSTTIYLVTNIDDLHTGMYISGNGITSSLITEVVSNIIADVRYITVDTAQTIAAGTEITATYKNLGQLLQGINYPGVKTQGINFNQAPGFDGPTPFDQGIFDNIQYDVDGLPMLDDNTVDTIIRSSYTDLALGTRAEDIDVVGGAYVDTYSSHAPEEMVPGIMFDTLDMQVYTKINGNVDVIAYRMFSNMMREESYLRIADAHATTLAAPLGLTDTEIVVADASKLTAPFVDSIGLGQIAIPGVIFINGERITYYTRNLLTNTLGQIRRGTQGTATPAIQYAGTVVTDGSADQLVPNVATNTAISTTAPYTVTSTRSYYLSLTDSVSANVGDVITQTISGASMTVAGIDSVARVLLVVLNNSNSLTFQDNYLELSGNVTVSSGDYITQSSTGANVTVLTTEANVSNVSVNYYGITTLTTGKTGGNIAINGSNVAVYPTTITGNVTFNSEIIINGTSTGNVYPLSIVPVGRDNKRNNVAAPFVDIDGNLTIDANIELHTTNVWYNLGTGVATDGTGFDGATTDQVLFLKASTATNIVVTAIKDMITTEDAVNTLTTEDGNTIIED